MYTLATKRRELSYRVFSSQKGLQLHETVILKQLSIYSGKGKGIIILAAETQDSVHGRERRRHKTEEVQKYPTVRR